MVGRHHPKYKDVKWNRQDRNGSGVIYKIILANLQTVETEINQPINKRCSYRCGTGTGEWTG